MNRNYLQLIQLSDSISYHNALLSSFGKEMKRSEKGSRGEASVLDSLGAVVLEGWLYRRSTAVDGVINRRYGVLYSQHIATFKHDKDREKKPPSKIWPLCGGCKSTELGKKEFLIRGKHSSTLWALATGHYEKKDLVSCGKFLSLPT